MLNAWGSAAMALNIKGKVVNENNSPLDFVNVMLLNADSTYIAGTVIDKNGGFIFDNAHGNPRFGRPSSSAYTTKTMEYILVSL